MARRTLSDLGVAALKARAKNYLFPDPELSGHFVRVGRTGAKSFMLVTRDPTGKQIWKSVGQPGDLAIEKARTMARAMKARIRAGLPAEEPKPERAETFREVSDNWIKRHVEAKGLRSKAEIERTLNKHVLPEWQDRPFVGIRRSDIAVLLDRIEDENGARQADLVLAHLRTMSGWYAARRDDYVPPFIRGMRRAPVVKRDRVLDDHELRAVWHQAEKPGQLGAIIRLAFMTAQRREKLASMRWDDIVDGVWIVPAEARSKGTGGALQLPAAALAIIEAQPRQEGNPYVFAGRTRGSHFDGFGKAKAAFDKALPAMPGWTLHDLRRTARSLMSRAGTRPDIAERVLGHVVPGVEGVYDRHKYQIEKAAALKSLEDLIMSIIAEQTGTTQAEGGST